MDTSFEEQLIIADERIELETALRLSAEQAQSFAKLAAYHDEVRLAQEEEDLHLAIRLRRRLAQGQQDEDKVVNRVITDSFDEHDAFTAEEDKRRRREMLHEYYAQQTVVDAAANVFGGARPVPRAFRASASAHASCFARPRV
ncbi:hypothetical protein JG687_00014142 [Phytophthora cactorum]|uniref:Uncharacterized protein n=1 Tax=Phytophthora cactorum TaxID=29920 RepID=A0A8T1TZG9_9STRA|nr:hypothetical protein JG687_00014142 [Phytophthora cactorum]